jgi:hypothetical protein
MYNANARPDVAQQLFAALDRLQARLEAVEGAHAQERALLDSALARLSAVEGAAVSREDLAAETSRSRVTRSELSRDLDHLTTAFTALRADVTRLQRQPVCPHAAEAGAGAGGAGGLGGQ